ncbi:MAG: dual specificity protein phosphatase family protein [Deltaproteobacteria bacterium]|nr:dual specificity protein phosphatase family protein [Deltaproteobacteria bacterium]
MASDFSRIDEFVIAGALPGARGGGASWRELETLGVSVLFSLVPRAIEGQPGTLHREIHALVDVVEPGTSGADIHYLERVVQRLNALRAAKRVTYVHCVSGVSRTGLVLAAWKMKHAGLGRDAALAWLRERRPTLAPNAAFMALLLEWERALRLG